MMNRDLVAVVSIHGDGVTQFLFHAPIKNTGGGVKHLLCLQQILGSVPSITSYKH